MTAAEKVRHGRAKGQATNAKLEKAPNRLRAAYYGQAYANDPDSFEDVLFIVQNCPDVPPHADVPPPELWHEVPMQEVAAVARKAMENAAWRMAHALKAGRLDYLEKLIAVRRTVELKDAARLRPALSFPLLAKHPLDLALIELAEEVARGRMPPPSLAKVSAWLGDRGVVAPADDKDLAKACDRAELRRAGRGGQRRRRYGKIKRGS